jgi:hypothetical protein
MQNSTQLIQKTLFTKKIWTINSAKLDIEETVYFRHREWSIPLDDIHPYVDKRKNNQSFMMFNLMIGILCFILWQVNFSAWAFILIGISFFVFLNRENNNALINTKNELLIINRNNPSQQVVDAFINALFQQQKDYLKWKFGTLDADLDFDIQIVNFRKLRNNKIISDEEYAQLKTALKDIIVAQKNNLSAS